jgi:hypothetical protein
MRRYSIPFDFMQTFLASLLIGLTATLASVAQVSITSIDGGGTITWTNRLCTSLPVYEILRADSLSGGWQHVAFVTNKNSFSLPNLPGAGGTAAFYRLAWVDHAPIVFDYVFDEGFGVPAVVGRFNLTFHDVNRQGQWIFEPTDFFFDEVHPVGTGQLRAQFAGDLLHINLTPMIFDGGFYLEGRLETAQDSSGCVFTQYSGSAYENTFSGGNEIGTFIATRVP